MNLGAQVLLAIHGAVTHGVIETKTSRLKNGEEVKILGIVYRATFGDQHHEERVDKNEEEICEVGPWNDSAQAAFVRENSGAKWATGYAKAMLTPAPTPADPVEPEKPIDPADLDDDLPL